MILSYLNKLKIIKKYLLKYFNTYSIFYRNNNPIK